MQLVEATRTALGSSLEVVWAVRESHVGNAFLDARASAFLVPELARAEADPSGFMANQAEAIRKGPLTGAEVAAAARSDRDLVALSKAGNGHDVGAHRGGCCGHGMPRGPSHFDHHHTASAAGDDEHGAEVGDDEHRHKTGRREGMEDDKVERKTDLEAVPCVAPGSRPVRVIYGAELVSLERCDDASQRNGGGASKEVRSKDGDDPEAEGWALRATLSDGTVLGADLVVSATGVVPATELAGPAAVRGSDGGLAVDRDLRTSLPRVYAAGDCCSVTSPESPEWFQMRLWSQAKMEGACAAQCIAAELTGGALGGDRHLCFNFDIFAHATTFFGMRCIFLGRFNGQGVPESTRAEMVRCTPGREFVKFVLSEGRLVGAVLIGETGLEETAENLIMNRIDLSSYGHDLLDPYNDLEDYFD